MKIVHLACVAPPVTGGIGRAAFEEVVRLQAKGQDALLLSARGGGDAQRIQRMQIRFGLGNAAIPHQKKLLERLTDADIVHLHYPYYGTAGVVARLRRAKKIKRLVITLHMDATATGLRGWIFSLHRRFFQKRILAAADILLCTSRDYIANSSYAYLRNDPRLIELPFGVDTERFSPGAAERKRFELPAMVPMVGFVGGMDTAHAFKGVDILLRAMAQLPLNVHLQLTGSGWLRHRYERLATELGIKDRCHFLGKARDGELPLLYRSMDVFAFPSVSSAEAFGLVALEAQACGIPVVASDLPGVRTVIADRQTGFLSPPNDVSELAAHLRLLLENPDLRIAFGAAGRAQVLEKFSWDKHIEKLIGIYFVASRKQA